MVGYTNKAHSAVLAPSKRPVQRIGSSFLYTSTPFLPFVPTIWHPMDPGERIHLHERDPCSEAPVEVTQRPGSRELPHTWEYLCR